MDDPDSIAFNSILHALAKSDNDNAAEYAEALLQKMEAVCAKGKKKSCPTVQSYTSVISAWAKRGESGKAVMIFHRLEQSNMIRPDTAAYTAVIDAFIKSGVEGSSEKAEIVLKRMEALYQNGDELVRPCIPVYHAVLNAYAASGERGSAQKAQNLLERMEKLGQNGYAEIAPNDVSYRIVMRAWQESKQKGFGDMIKMLHGRMKHLAV